MTTRTYPPRQALGRWPWSLSDIAILLGVIGLISLLVAVGRGAFVAFRPPEIVPSINLAPSYLPYYLARSTLRMFVALGCSLIFTVAIGGLAARNVYAERIIIPALDVLQSVPVLGFLSVTVSLFIALFPGSLIGLEAASIFAIFTGQVWNMTFAFYYALRAVPAELDEASRLYRLTRWQRFWKVGVPSTMIGLVWNTMMSFGGGWFFVSASEAITVLNNNYTLPGIGAYVAEAVRQQNVQAIVLAVLAMATLILLTDQLLWRPLVAWSDCFKLEASASSEAPTSWFYDFLRTSHVLQYATDALRRLQDWLAATRSITRTTAQANQPQAKSRPWPLWVHQLFQRLYTVGLIVLICVFGFFVLRLILSELGASEIALVFGLGLLTLLRIVVLIMVISLIFIPIGVAIGFSPKLARVAQPVVQFLASFPSTFLFPFVTILFISGNVSMELGSILLMSLGAQWYVLFNVIAGARSIPTEMREMAAITRVRGWQVWRRMILPGIFPSWVTGALTAYGGAFNASIVAEISTWGNTTLAATGIGAYIQRATTSGDWPRIALGISVMTVIVVVINRVLWRRLYAFAEAKFFLIRRF